MLNPVSKLDLQDFFRDVSRARQSALVLDYDGTLAPFKINRAEAAPYEGVTSLLQQIVSTRPGTYPAIGTHSSSGDLGNSRTGTAAQRRIA